MASVDLKHAYYSVPVAKEFQKFLKFKWKGQLYCFTCLPNGLACCPRLFTKIMKPVFATLRQQVFFLSVSFIDDSYLQGDSENECQRNIDSTVQLLESLGFTINIKKSVLTPRKEIKFLGFLLNSEKVTVSLTHERAEKMLTACKGLKKQQKKIHNKGVGTGDWTAGSCLSRLTVGVTFFFTGV